MEIYEATPDGEPRGAVIVVQEAFGVNDHIQDVARRFARGLPRRRPALFHRGRGTAPLRRLHKVMPLFEGVTDDGILADVDATLAHLEDAGFSREQIGIVGYCFGGRVTFLVAARRKLGAAVGFYGGGIAAPGGLPFPPLIGESSSLQTPWLGLFGDLDQGISIESVEDLRTALGDAPVPADIVRYPDAEHGFHCDARESYHAESAADGWQRALEWFRTHLG